MERRFIIILVLAVAAIVAIAVGVAVPLSRSSNSNDTVEGSAMTDTTTTGPSGIASVTPSTLTTPPPTIGATTGASPPSASPTESVPPNNLSAATAVQFLVNLKATNNSMSTEQYSLLADVLDYTEAAFASTSSEKLKDLIHEMLYHSTILVDCEEQGFATDILCKDALDSWWSFFFDEDPPERKLADEMPNENNTTFGIGFDFFADLIRTAESFSLPDIMNYTQYATHPEVRC